MRREPNTLHHTRSAALVAGVAILAVLAAGCSSSAGSGGTKSTAPPPAVTRSSVAPPTSSAAAPSSASAPAKTGLSGKWSGQYSGAYTGTFKLDWQQTGSKLSGSITLSDPGDTVSLNGTVTGTAISFGTVGSAVITYSGTVSGDSMSGSYKVGGATGGDWSATKSS